MLKKILLPALALGAMGAIVTSAQAYEVSDYVQFNIGQAKSESVSLGPNTSSSRTSAAYKAAFGVKFNNYLALETQYIDLGKATHKRSGHKLSMETNGIGANFIASYPVEDFSLFAKVGYHFLRSKGSYKYTSFYGAHSERDSLWRWSPSLGFGVSYAVTGNIAVTAEYEYFNDVGRVSDIEFASVGLRYHF